LNNNLLPAPEMTLEWWLEGGIMNRIQFNFFKLVPICLAGLFFTACAHHPDVRPGADGLHRLSVRGAEKQSTERDALKQTQSYCKQSKKQPAIVNENIEYTGSMDEATRDRLRNVSKAVAVTGGSMGVLGGKNERTAGAVLGGAGTAGAIATGEDAYVVNMTFRCQ
jgi:hypothetical protein